MLFFSSLKLYNIIKYLESLQSELRSIVTLDILIERIFTLLVTSGNILLTLRNLEGNIWKIQFFSQKRILYCDCYHIFSTPRQRVAINRSPCKVQHVTDKKRLPNTTCEATFHRSARLAYWTDVYGCFWNPSWRGFSPAVVPLDVLWSPLLASDALLDAVPSISSPRIDAPCGTSHRLSATRIVSYKHHENVTVDFRYFESVRENDWLNGDPVVHWRSIRSQRSWLLPCNKRSSYPTTLSAIWPCSLIACNFNKGKKREYSYL